MKKEDVERLLGRHRWDVLEYDKFKFINLYPGGNLDQKMIVVIAASTKDTGDVADTVIGYMNDSEQNEELPSNLFDQLDNFDSPSELGNGTFIY